MGPDGRGSYCYGHVNCNDAINRPHDLTNEAIAIRATIECLRQCPSPTARCGIAATKRPRRRGGRHDAGDLAARWTGGTGGRREVKSLNGR